MIEAINASISNAPIVRAIAEEVSTSQSVNPVRIQKAAVTAPYLSPHVRLSPNAKPVFVVRDVETGTQIKQFPTEAQIRAYQKAGEARSQVQAQSSQGEVKTITPEQARIMIETSVQYKEERAAVKYDTQVSVPGAKDESYEQAAPATFNEQA
ncbi:MAG: hypothetical protein DI586_01495 [Micavibrio aeruginosavorus]|uniref:Uncharacterized protein n=1 Tax=Micavibrio aeruginosavorus TaxID=349221 RepID=A0A2W5HG21_9BACT|nr:MAG: hypothetical protein DI586_01495 [Micavibrio aeruginosavorus]